LPYAVAVDVDDPESAIAHVDILQADEQRHLFYPEFLVDLSEGVIKRLIQPEGADGWQAVDAAFDVVGTATPDEYFAEAETMEMDL
jgi:hypothetical protein